MPKMPTKKNEWNNDPVIEPTPREEKLAALAEKAMEVKPQTYNVTSKNAKAIRVIHDYHGRTVAIEPGDTKQGVLLRPDTAEYLGRGDLILTAA